MGFGGIGIWQLLIILLIVVLLFGTKRIKSLGGDIGDAIKGFRKAVNDDKAGEDKKDEAPGALGQDPAPKVDAAAKTNAKSESK